MVDCLRDDVLSFKKVILEEVRLLRPGDAPAAVTHTPVEPRLFAMNNWALCLSGGGIRSAAFCFGVLNALIDAKLLPRFDYLSTVSGGGFIGAWLSAAVARLQDRGGIQALEETGQVTPLGFDAVGHLRRNVHYLATMPGIPGNSTWIFSSLYLQKLLLAWIAAFPLLAVITILPDALWPSHYRVLPGSAYVPLASFAFLLGGWSWYHFLTRPLTDRPLLKGRVGFNWFVAATFLWAVTVMTVWTSYSKGTAQPLEWNSFKQAAFLFLLLPTPLFGYLLALVFFRRRLSCWLWVPVIVAQASEFAVLYYCAWVSYSLGAITIENPWAVVPLVIVGRLAGVWAFRFVAVKLTRRSDWDWWDAAQFRLLVASIAWLGTYAVVRLGPPLLTDRPGRGLTAFAVALVAALLFTVLLHSSSLDLNTFRKPRAWVAGVQATTLLACGVVTISAILIFMTLLLHLVYKFASFLLGSEVNMSLGHVAIALVLLCVIPALIGFLIDPNDLSIHSFYRDSLVRTFLGASRKRSPDPITGMDSDDDLSLVDIGHVPLHVINAAKRVRLDGDAAAFGPMTTSFTFSPLHCGSEDTYRPSTEYGKRISLGTAVAISGAAIALNLRAASPLVTLARSLLSSGLGIWLGNPVHATAWSRRGPGHPLVPLWEEFFARSTYLHISDGGHFENLGVYEMLRRRCRTIVVVDASWDPIGACADLVGLMYRARSELQTSIDVDIKGLQDAAGRFLHHVALGKISYPDAAIGEIHYIKPVLTGNEDMEVRTYHALNNAFPQETTLDQWFTGSQFEAYRQLGLQSGRELVERRLKEAVTEQERQPFA